MGITGGGNGGVGGGSGGGAVLQVLKKHTVNISDLCWSHDSTELLSGGYDQTCKLWEVESGRLIDSFDCEGFVQCVSFCATQGMCICLSHC